MLSVLLFYDWFLPAYKAGGPIQSIANLIKNLDEDYSFYIVSGNTDHGEVEPLANIIADKWLPFENLNCKVIYLSKPNQRFSTIKKLVKQIDPDTIITNGLYTLPFSIFPILVSTCKRIITPRGALHPGALSQKKTKKKVFLLLFKWLGLHKKVTFCATDEVEVKFIKQQFGSEVKVEIAGNFPQIHNYLVPPEKKDALIIGSVGLISAMKNHHLVLLALQQCTSYIVYEIFGPVKDPGYWEECKALIEQLPENIKVNYHGEIPPGEIKNKIEKLHYFILPSKSENFGHAIFEALSVGRPVIVSNYTPWNLLEENSAGFNVDIHSIETISNALQKAALQTQKDYILWTIRSREYALKAIDVELIKEQYGNLFAA